MAFFKIPLNQLNQNIMVRLDQKNYKLQTIYRIDTWYLDIFDSADNILITALPMVQGIDLLEQYQHIIRGSLYVHNTTEKEQQEFSGLGFEMNLYWEDPL